MKAKIGKISILAFLMIMITIAAGGVAGAADYTFQTTGGGKVRGEIERTEPGTVVVRDRSTGEQTRLPVQSLTEESQNYVRDWLEIRNKYKIYFTAQTWDGDATGTKTEGLAGASRKRQATKTIVFSLANKSGQEFEELYAESQVLVQTRIVRAGQPNETTYTKIHTPHLKIQLEPGGDPVRLQSRPIPLVEGTESNVRTTTVTKIDSDGRFAGSYTDHDRRTAWKQEQEIAGFWIKVFRKSDRKEVGEYKFFESEVDESKIGFDVLEGIPAN